MGEQLTPADAALLSRVLGHEIEPGLVRTLGPSTLAAIIQAARSEGPRPERVVPCYECGSTERIGTACKPCNPELVAQADSLFMCKTDFEDELGCAAGGNTVFPSLNDLKRNRKCWDSCGVVEVSVSFVSDVVAQDLSFHAPPPPKGEALPVAWPNDKPPPHWTPDDKYDRHPKTVEAWDWRQDPGGDERAAHRLRRLNFAADFADPRAPDQMALVLRGDLIDVKHRLTRSEALRDLYKSQLDIAKADARPSPGVSLPVVITDEMVKRASIAFDEYVATIPPNDEVDTEPCVRVALEAALLSRGEG